MFLCSASTVGQRVGEAHDEHWARPNLVMAAPTMRGRVCVATLLPPHTGYATWQMHACSCACSCACLPADNYNRFRGVQFRRDRTSHNCSKVSAPNRQTNTGCVGLLPPPTATSRCTRRCVSVDVPCCTAEAANRHSAGHNLLEGPALQAASGSIRPHLTSATTPRAPPHVGRHRCTGDIDAALACSSLKLQKQELADSFAGLCR